MMQSDPIILAFDTAGPHDSLSLYHKGILTSKVLLQGGRQLQSSFLVPSLIHLLAQKNLP